MLGQAKNTLVEVLEEGVIVERSEADEEEASGQRG